MSDPKFELNGIQEDDFLRWKHHPVTKVFLRYLMDYEAQVAQKQVAILRTAVGTPDPFMLGMFNGQINAVGQMASLSFDDLVEFYPDPDQEEDA